MFLFSLVYPAGAISDETTGLTLDHTDTNQGKMAVAGNFMIFATDRKLLFYDLTTGALEKTYNTIDFGASDFGYTNQIKTLDSSTILISTMADIVGNNNYLYVYVEVLNVNTLASTVIKAADNRVIKTSSTSTYRGCYQSPIITLGTSSYVLAYADVKGSSQNYSLNGLYRIYPTWAALNETTFTTNDALAALWDASIVIPSNSANEFYVISGDNNVGMALPRYQITKVNVASYAVTILGSSGLDFDYGVFAYYVDYVYHTTTTGNTYYDVLVAYPNSQITKSLFAQIIRFNDTYIGADTRESLTASSSAVSIVRPFTFRLPSGVWGNGSLTNGYYDMAYVGGANYEMYMFPMTLSGLETETPTWTGLDPQTFQGKTHYYNTAGSVGGFLSPYYQVGIFYDYTNGKAVSDTFMPINPVMIYTYYVVPAPAAQLGYNLSLGQATSYQYTGEIFVNGLLNSEGNYTVSTTALSTSLNVAFTASYTQQVYQAFQNGTIQFTISPRSSSQQVVYQGIKINLATNDGAINTTITHTVSFTSTTQGSPPTPAIPTDSSQAASVGVGQIVNVAFPLFIFGVIPLAGAMYAGFAGLFICFNAAGIIVSMSGLLPPYVIIVVILADVVALYMRPQIETFTTTLRDKVRPRRE